MKDGLQAQLDKARRLIAEFETGKGRAFSSTDHVIGERIQREACTRIGEDFDKLCRHLAMGGMFEMPPIEISNTHDPNSFAVEPVEPKLDSDELLDLAYKVTMERK